MAYLPICETIVEIFGDDEVHIVFSRTGLPWSLHQMPGLHVEQVPSGIEDGVLRVDNVVMAPTNAIAYDLAQHFLASGWHLMVAVIHNQTIPDSISLDQRLRDRMV